MQLYSTKKKISQVIEGHTATFATLMSSGHELTLFAFASRTSSGGKLHIIEVGQDRKDPSAPKFDKKQVDVAYPPEMASDFPVSLQVRNVIVIQIFSWSVCTHFQLEIKQSMKFDQILRVHFPS